MSEGKRDYEIGYGKPPAGRRFQKGRSGNPRGPRRKDLSALLIAALNEPVYTTIDGHRRKITKREAIIKQMVDKSADADLRATKMLFDMLKEVEEKAGTASSPEPAALTAPDREKVEALRLPNGHNEGSFDQDLFLVGRLDPKLAPGIAACIEPVEVTDQDAAHLLPDLLPLQV